MVVCFPPLHRLSVILLFQLLAILTFTLAALAQDSNEIKIGWIGPLTGNAATLGIDSPAAVELAFEKVNAAGGIGKNGTKLRLLIEDDQYNSSKTVASYNKLVHQDGAKILIVVTYGGLFAISQRAEKDGVVLIDPLDCDKAIAALPSHVFCVAKATEQLGTTIADLLEKSTALPAAVLYYDGDPFMGTVAKTLKSESERRKISLSTIETYNDTTVDFRAFLTRVRSSQAKSLVFMGYDQTGLAMKQARELGIRIPFYAVAGIMQGPGFAAAAQGAAEGTVGPIWIADKNANYDAFISQFEKKVHRKPMMDLCTVPSYDVGALVANALQNGGWDGKENVDTEFVKKYLYSVKDYSGASGKITIESDGAAKGYSISVVQYKAGALVPVQ